MTAGGSLENPQPGAPLAEARGLVKRFGDFTAVDGIDFEVRPGEAFGFLGPNGAGKTSAMRMLGCTSPVTDGHLRVFGLDPAGDGPRIRSRLGVVAQMDNLDLELSVEDNLVIYGRYFGISRAALADKVNELLAFGQLSERRTSKVDPLSGGMKRRLSIARALVNDPDLILLDEPTTGLDPQARQLLWDRLWSLKSDGVSLVITTHYMDEAEQLCDRLVVMDQGKIVDEGSPSALIERHCPREVVEVRYRSPESQAVGAAAATALGLRVDDLRDRLVVYTDDSNGLIHKLEPEAGAVRSSLTRRASLEDVFLTLTGRTLDD